MISPLSMRMRVPELVRREAPTDAGRDGGLAQLSSGCRSEPRVGPPGGDRVRVRAAPTLAIT
jgi:hypothetical protein